MSQQEPIGPYVYQPYGSVTHPDRAKTGRLYGVAGVDYAATISGLTKDEAERVVSALVGTRAEAILRGLEAWIEAQVAAGMVAVDLDRLLAQLADLRAKATP